MATRGVRRACGCNRPGGASELPHVDETPAIASVDRPHAVKERTMALSLPPTRADAAPVVPGRTRPAGPPRAVAARRALLRGAAVTVFAAVAPRTVSAQATEGDPGRMLPFNGFDVGRSLLPLDAIVQGGPPRDGIASIDRPRFVPARQAKLAQADRVLGVVHRGIARAYPVRILNWHEVVNDRFAGEPVAVTYCPLCGSGVVFDALVGGRTLSFGVSGLLFDSDVLLYDRQTESLWSQLKFQAVTGPMIGTRLARLPVEHTSWQDWRARHPRTELLSFETGFERDYARDPYLGYDRDPATFFPVSRSDPRLEPKTWVVGVERNGRTKAYPIEALGRQTGTLRDTVGGEQLLIHYDGEHRTARVTDGQGRAVPAVTAFWFAWATFNPETEVHAPPAGR